MATTLKQKLTTKKLHQLQERLTKVDKKVILSEIKYGPRDLLLLEALDSKQAEVAFDIIKKLNATDFAPVTAFNDVKKLVLDDVKKVLAGQSSNPVAAISNFFKKVTGNSDKINNDPLSTAMAFVDSTRNFFEDMTKLVTSMNLPADKTIKDGITASDNNKSGGSASAEIDKNNKEAQKQIKLMGDIIKKSLRPDFDASKLGQNWVHKYLPGLVGGKGLTMIVDGILSMKPNELKAKSELVTRNFANASAEGNQIATAAGKGSETTGSEQTKSTTGSEPTSGGTPSEPSKTGAVKSTSGNKKLKDDHVKEMAQDFAKKSGVDANATFKVLKALNDNEKLKESFLRFFR